MTILETQLAYQPQVEGDIEKAPVIVIGGMGGSAIPALVARFLGTSPYVIMHRDYGLPSPVPSGARYVAISYSGDTEEALSFANEALEKDLPLSVIASGGKLLALAKEHSLPYVEVPHVAQPRDSIIATTKALLALLGEDAVFPESFDAALAENDAALLAEALAGRVPIFYASGRNEALAYVAKIQCNETAKVPAFSNVFPEFNHNELEGYGTSADELLDPFTAVFIRDESDTERVRRRMDRTEELLIEKGVRTERITLPAGTRADAFLYGWWLLRTAARSLAATYDVAPEETPLITAFKESL